MTDNVYVLELASGRHVKLQVLSYYSPDVQTACNHTGMVTDFRVRWAFLD
jgi:hypothetical protein